MRYLTLITTLLVAAQVGFCADEAGDLSSALKTAQGEPNILSVLISLVIVIALIYITGIIYTKLNVVGAQSVKKQFKNNNLDRIVVLSTTPLGQNKNLHIVEINDKKLLIGATPNSINMIKELSDDDLLFDKPSSEKAKPEKDVMDTLFNDKNSELNTLQQDHPEKNYEEDFEKAFSEDFGLYKKYL